MILSLIVVVKIKDFLSITQHENMNSLVEPTSRNQHLLKTHSKMVDDTIVWRCVDLQTQSFTKPTHNLP